MTKTLGTIIFDLDGTLVDSARDLLPVLDETIGDYGLPPVDPEKFAPLISYGALRMLEDAFERHGIDLSEADVSRALEKFLGLYESRIARESIFFDGCLGSLDSLASDGWLFAIATNKYERLAKLLVSELGALDYFAVIAGGDTFDVRKPDPGHLTNIVEMLGGDISSSIMVGDSLNDILAARNAGIPSIGVTFGYTTVPVTDMNPTEIISHYSELRDVVGRIRGIS